MRRMMTVAVLLIFAAAGAAKAQVIPFDACGTLVEGVECLLFHSDNSGTYLLDNYDGFGVGARVHVTGRVDSSCVSICMEGNGCIWDNTIAECESPSPCSCPCHADPDCDGIHSDVRAVVGTVDAAFRGSVPAADSSCPWERTDVNCEDDNDPGRREGGQCRLPRDGPGDRVLPAVWSQGTAGLVEHLQD